MSMRDRTAVMGPGHTQVPWEGLLLATLPALACGSSPSRWLQCKLPLVCGCEGREGEKCGSCIAQGAGGTLRSRAGCGLLCRYQPGSLQSAPSQ